MKIDSDKFRVNHGKAIKLSKLPTNIKPLCDTKEKYQSVLTRHVSDLSDLQPKINLFRLIALKQSD